YRGWNAAIRKTARAGCGRERRGSGGILGPVDPRLRLSVCLVHGPGLPKPGPRASDTRLRRQEVRPLPDQQPVGSGNGPYRAFDARSSVFILDTSFMAACIL